MDRQRVKKQIEWEVEKIRGEKSREEYMKALTKEENRMNVSGQSLQPSAPKEEKDLQRNINRVGTLHDSLGSISMRASRLASELLGPIPEGEKTGNQREAIPGLMGNLSGSLDNLEHLIGELGYTIERMESLA